MKKFGTKSLIVLCLLLLSAAAVFAYAKLKTKDSSLTKQITTEASKPIEPKIAVAEQSQASTQTPVVASTMQSAVQPAGVPVLMYHYVGDLPPNADPVRKDLTVSTQDFQSQMQFLQQDGYTAITPDQLYGWLAEGQSIPKKSMLIILDDGYTDTLSTVVPLLSGMHMTATFAIITGFTSGTVHAAWPQIIVAEKQGMIMVSHSYNHIDMAEHSYTDQDYSIGKSTEDFVNNLGFVPKYFVYPDGGYTSQTEQILQNHGYVMAFTTAYGFANKGENLLEIPRIRIHGAESMARFEYDVAGVPLPAQSETDSASQIKVGQFQGE